MVLILLLPTPLYDFIIELYFFLPLLFLFGILKGRFYIYRWKGFAVVLRGMDLGAYNIGIVSYLVRGYRRPIGAFAYHMFIRTVTYIQAGFPSTLAFYSGHLTSSRGIQRWSGCCRASFQCSVYARYTDVAILVGGIV